MKAIPVASVILSVAFSTLAFAAAAPNYKIIDRIKVQDGGFRLRHVRRREPGRLYGATLI